MEGLNGKGKIKITFYGGVGNVTGANFLLEEENGPKILLDCGLFQGQKFCDTPNRDAFSYDSASIDYLFISHAHMDHIGRIPLLIQRGFKGKIYSTPPTKEISELMLVDSLGVLEKEAKREGESALYSTSDVEKAMSLWETIEYHEKITIKNFCVYFKNSGHIMGSAMVYLLYNNQRIVYTGDLGNSPNPFLPDTEPLIDANFLIMESVYGDRNHPQRDAGLNMLEDAIEDIVKTKGTLMIPAFSIEKTQELLFEIKKMMEGSRIPLIRVFLDSPLSINVTRIYKKYINYYNEKARKLYGDDPEFGIFNFPQLHPTLTTEQSKTINDVNPPKIIIAGSGMSNGGRILHHERRYLKDKNSILLLAGYQSPNTLGRQLQDGNKRVKILGEDIDVRAKIVTISGYSAHKGSDDLFEFVNRGADPIKQIFITLGEPKSSLFMVQRIRDNLAISTVAPKTGESFYLDI